MKSCIYLDLGLTDYEKAWEIQKKIHSDLIRYKTANPFSHIDHQLLFCEHPHVFTLGKSGNVNNLLIHEKLLSGIGAAFYKTDRGGDITYHGPGQIVGYPLFDLQDLDLGIKKYIYLLEQSVIDTLAEFSIPSERYPVNTGVWTCAEGKKVSEKICSVGVRVSRLVSMHGFALNVNTDLSYFTYINPCGLSTHNVTSMEKEKGEKLNNGDVKRALCKHIAANFGMEIRNCDNINLQKIL